MLKLQQFVCDFAEGLREADRERPVARSMRSGIAFAAGIGPHTEAATVALVMTQLRQRWPERYENFEIGVPYPKIKRQRCDLCIGTAPSWDWAVEVKLLRMLGDNGQPNDNMLMHILSPYPAHRSALTDCRKLLGAGLGKRNAILIYGFEHSDWPLEPAIAAFEALARATFTLGPRCTAAFDGLIHRVHDRGAIFAWELHSESHA